MSHDRSALVSRVGSSAAQDGHACCIRGVATAVLRRPGRVLAGAIATVLLAGLLSSCSRASGPKKEKGNTTGTPAVRKEFGTGPVRLTIELSSAELTTADALTCTMSLQVGEGYEAELPDLVFPDDLPGMILTRTDEHEAKVAKGRQLVRLYELEPEFDGEFEWPALQVYYHRSGDVKEEVIETEPIAFEVQPTPATAEMMAIKPVRGLVTAEQIEAQRRRVWPWVLGGTLGSLLLIALVVYWARRPRRAAPPPPPHEIAIEALRALAARDLIAKGEIDLFFVEITSIVRQYIEWAFGLRAPEQTTEEFMAGIASSPVVARHRESLDQFLTAADEVKFARLTPDPTVIQRTFDTARNFILATSGVDGEAG